MTKRRVRFAAWLLALLLVIGIAVSAQAQQPVVHYVYDDLGRLVGVVDPDGNAASYTYDAVGNILAIGRHNVADTPGPVAITLVSPNKGKVRTEVLIFGKGFSPDPAQNAVAFGGAPATVSAATPNSLTTSVPPGALTGLITVTTPLGTATSPEPFTVLGVITVNPKNAVLFLKASQQFTATDSGGATPTVTWSVNGVVGGDATVGTITPTGLYSAPAAVPSPPTLTVTATNTSEPSLFDSATVVIVDAPDKIFAKPVSVAPVALTSSAVNNLTARPVSIQVANPLSSVVTALQAPLVSVAPVALTSSAVNNLTARPVSVQMANPLSTVVTALQAQPVSVAPAALSGQSAFLTSSLVAVAPQPVIVAVSPSTGLRGAAGLSVLLQGAGFTNATGVSFQLNGSNDADLSVTNLTVSPDGTEATLTLSIAAGALPGSRVVRITTPSGTSTAAATGGNVFTVE